MSIKLGHVPLPHVCDPFQNMDYNRSKNSLGCRDIFHTGFLHLYPGRGGAPYDGGYPEYMSSRLFLLLFLAR
jgi:hypothetical protein